MIKQLLVIISCFSFIPAFPQAVQTKIVGIVYEKNASGSKKPVPRGASVFIPGIGSTSTDDKGYYSIDLSQCKTCSAGETVKIYVNSSIGYADREITIPNNPSLKPFDIEISENSKLAVNGIIRDKRTGKFLKGIKVVIVIQNYDLTIPSTLSDDNGVFQIIIRKEGITNMQAIQVLFSDPNNNKYKDLEKVAFINQFEPIKVDMEECSDCGAHYNLKINSFYKSKIKVEEGDLVTIKAGGVMKVGGFVGNSGPEGIPNNRGVLGMSLEVYNYFKIWNHAALTFRFGDKDEWKYYNEKENKFIAQKSGFMEFGINDNQQNDNEGAYEVEILIRK